MKPGIEPPNPDSGKEAEQQNLLQRCRACGAQGEYTKRGSSVDQHTSAPVAISNRSKPKGTQHEADESGTENDAELVWRNMQWSRHHRGGYADRQKVESVEQRYETAQHDDPDLQRPERTPVDQLGDINKRRY